MSDKEASQQPQGQLDSERPQLNDDDMKRVEQYLNSPIHQVERKPFNPWYFLLLTFGSVTGLLGLAILVTKLSGVEID